MQHPLRRWLFPPDRRLFFIINSILSLSQRNSPIASHCLLHPDAQLLSRPSKESVIAILQGILEGSCGVRRITDEREQTQFVEAIGRASRSLSIKQQPDSLSEKLAVLLLKKS